MSSTLQDTATQVRRDILRMVHAVQSGHPGGSLGCTDFVTALYFDVMDYSTDFHMDAADEDVFILSNGHISPLLYSVLARRNFFPLEELNTFRKLNSRLQGHPATEEGLPGIRVATGSLGQGLSVGLGIAKSKKINGDENLVYVLLGDGEIQEGQVWEAALFGAHQKLDNVIATIDVNGQQIDGPTKEVMNIEVIREKWTAFGWECLDMKGNDMDDVLSVLKEAKSKTKKGKPICILMQTEMGYGVDFMQGTHEWHGIAPSDEQLEQALAQLPETIGDF